MANSSSSSGGIGLAGATFLVFLVLKLTHVIAWSWLWVTAPLWGGVALILGIAAGIAGAFGVYAGVDSLFLAPRRRKRAELRREEYMRKLGRTA
jgi:hypothetical protein